MAMRIAIVFAMCLVAAQGMDAPDFETPLGEQLKELEKSPMLDDAEFADFDEEMPIEDDIELGESDDQSDQLFEAAIRKDLRAEKSALSEIGHDEEKGETEAEELIKDAKLDEKQEQRNSGYPADNTADDEHHTANPFGEEDEDEDEDNELGEEGWDGEKFSGDQKFNEGLLADNLHHENQDEKAESNKIELLALKTADKMGKDAKRLQQFQHEKEKNQPQLAKFAEMTANKELNAQKKLEAAIKRKPDVKLENEMERETNRLATDESSSKAVKDDESVESQAKSLEDIEKAADAYVKDIAKDLNK